MLIVHQEKHSGYVSVYSDGVKVLPERGPEGFAVPNGAPRGFVEHAFERSFVAPFPVGRVWGWLNDPATFTEGQVWPYRSSLWTAASSRGC